MNQNEKFNIEFYKHLSSLFYAIAFADKKIEDIELSTLKKNIIALNIVPKFDDPKNGATAELLMLSTINKLQVEGCSAETCYDDFLRYKRMNEDIFTPSLKQSILKIAGKIASSFSGTNKSELIMLARLDIEFKKQTNEQ